MVDLVVEVDDLGTQDADHARGKRGRGGADTHADRAPLAPRHNRRSHRPSGAGPPAEPRNDATVR